MKFAINTKSKVAVFQQIINMVLFGIYSGELKEGDQLPSTRVLSEKLGTNPNTINKVYEYLKAIEVVSARPGMGVYIKENVTKQVKDRVDKYMAAKLREVTAEANACKWNRKALDLEVGKHWNNATKDKIY